MARIGTTNQGHEGGDGQLRDYNGNTIAAGYDSATIAELNRQIAGPKLRHLPSEKDVFAQHSGTREAVTFVLANDAVASGGAADLSAATPSTTD